MLTNQIVTVWKRYNNEKYEHNHISNGFFEDENKPTPINDLQMKKWKNAKWKKYKGHFDGIKIIIDE